jgi:hypothetical protein
MIDLRSRLAWAKLIMVRQLMRRTSEIVVVPAILWVRASPITKVGANRFRYTLVRANRLIDSLVNLFNLKLQLNFAI